jgi:Phospholipase_D-nuclease N-terminal
MSFVVLLLISVGVTIYALVDCWRSTDDEVRGLPRPAWVLLIVLVGPLGLPPFGAAAYLLLGRATTEPRPGRVLAPDDDPDFLRKLDLERRRAAAMEQHRREQRERKEREKQERQLRKEERKERKNEAGETGPGATEGGSGDGHSGRPTA